MYRGRHNESKVSISRDTGQQSESNLSSRLQPNNYRLLVLLLNRLSLCKITQAFERVRVIPLKEEFIQKRMKKVIEKVFKRQDYLSKWDAFQNIKRTSLASEKLQHERLKIILKKQRGTAIKLLTHFMLGKKRDILHSMLKRIKQRADINHHKYTNNMRRAFRNMSRIFNRRLTYTFFKVKDSRAIVVEKKRLWNMVRIIKEIRTQNIRWAFVLMRRQMVRDRQEKVKEDIEQLDEKLKAEEDQELTTLQNRHKELNEQLETVKKQKDELQVKLDEQVKLVQVKQKQMDDHLQGLKKKQQDMRKRIDQIDESLQTPFSLEEIYQLCYENLLWTISQNPSKKFSREELLKSLEVPMVPIDLPLEQLKEQNQILKDLISQYVLIYGEKKLPAGCKLELPYEYLLKENNLLYKMLKTLLPKDQFLRQELHKIRETYETVQVMVKECTSK